MSIKKNIFRTYKSCIKFRGENGLDTGGLTKDWLELLINELLDPKNGLFYYIGEDNMVLPTNKNALKNKYYKLLGRLLGKLITERNTAKVPLDNIILKYILNQDVTYEDFKLADKAYFLGLNSIRSNLTALEFNFTNSFGKNLVCCGSIRKVSENNVEEYIRLSLESKYGNGIKKQCDLIKEGLYEIIDAKLFEGWTTDDFRILICGNEIIDIDSWKIHTNYINFSEEKSTIKWFWEILRKLSDEDKSKLLHFVTGSSRLPVTGFCNLRKVDGSKKIPFTILKMSDMKLPIAHTCSNLLSLREYENKESLEKDIKIIIENYHTGFECD